MKTANLMLNEMKAANDRRKSYHPDSLLQLSRDNPVSDFPLSTPFRQSMTEFPSQTSHTVHRPLSASLDSNSFQTFSNVITPHPLSEAHNRMSLSMVSVGPRVCYCGKLNEYSRLHQYR
jgi:classical protein kinase C/novel protein kinase C epsilon type